MCLCVCKNIYDMFLPMIPGKVCVTFTLTSAVQCIFLHGKCISTCSSNVWVLQHYWEDAPVCVSKHSCILWWHAKHIFFIIRKTSVTLSFYLELTSILIHWNDTKGLMVSQTYCSCHLLFRFQISTIRVDPKSCSSKSWMIRGYIPWLSV